MNFDELANQHKDAVYKQMLRVCGNREDAEDVLIEALLKAYRSLNQLRDAEAFRGWLSIIARRLCWHLKSNEVLLPLIQLSALRDGGSELSSNLRTPEAQFASAEMKSLLDAAIRELPDTMRQVFILRDMEELGGDEVAARLGITLAAMKSRLHRARALIREYLDESLLQNSHSS